MYLHEVIKIHQKKLNLEEYDENDEFTYSWR